MRITYKKICTESCSPARQVEFASLYNIYNQSIRGEVRGTPRVLPIINVCTLCTCSAYVLYVFNTRPTCLSSVSSMLLYSRSRARVFA